MSFFMSHGNLRHTAAGDAGPVAAGAGQRFVLRDAELGLAVIFGLLNVINFAHGALYMMGAFAAWMGLTYFGLNYWVMLVLAPLLVGLFGIADRAHHAALAVQARPPVRPLADVRHHAAAGRAVPLVLRGRRASRIRVPEALTGATNLGFMILPNYRAWVVAGVAGGLLRHLVRDREDPARRLSARRHRKPETGRGVRHQRAADGDADLRLRRRAGGLCRRAGGAGDPGLAADGAEPDHRRVRRGGDRRHGLDHGLDRHRPGSGRDRGPDPGVLSARPRPPSCS